MKKTTVVLKAPDGVTAVACGFHSYVVTDGKVEVCKDCVPILEQLGFQKLKE